MVSIISNLTAEQFQEKAMPWLMKREAENNLPLGVVSNLLRKLPEDRLEHHLWVVEKDGQVAGSAFWTPPYQFTLTQMPVDCLEALAREVARAHSVLPGVGGPKEAAKAFAHCWGEKTKASTVLDLSMRIYELREVEPVPAVPGRMRLAKEEELTLLTAWYAEFNREADLKEKIDERKQVEGHFREDRLVVWDDEGTAALAAYALTSPRGARIYMVYTPPERRRRGYATSLTAALSQTLLDSGRKCCFLYTDLSNPVSNSIYQKIGYRPVCDWDVYSFS